ncbi:MAG: hypothetical protein EOO92_14040 [Pedobacter sp.]|nr:MAG: hypothetical protein EOO92_14040 [Pedobacter sp.]
MKQFPAKEVMGFMEPFNVKIGYGSNEVTLTILPAGENYYKVIYYGAIIGAVKYDIDSWELVPLEEVEAGDLPFYRHDVNSGKVNVVMNEATADEIGEEINHYYHKEED